MAEINVNRVHLMAWEFNVGEDFKYFPSTTDKCQCGMSIDVRFVKIIRKLKKAGLLSKDFEMLCCGCYHVASYRGKKGHLCPECHNNLHSFISGDRSESEIIRSEIIIECSCGYNEAYQFNKNDAIYMKEASEERNSSFIGDEEKYLSWLLNVINF